MLVHQCRKLKRQVVDGTGYSFRQQHLKDIARPGPASGPGPGGAVRVLSGFCPGLLKCFLYVLQPPQAPRRAPKPVSGPVRAGGQASCWLNTKARTGEEPTRGIRKHTPCQRGNEQGHVGQGASAAKSKLAAPAKQLLNNSCSCHMRYMYVLLLCCLLCTCWGCCPDLLSLKPYRFTTPRRQHPVSFPSPLPSLFFSTRRGALIAMDLSEH